MDSASKQNRKAAREITHEPKERRAEEKEEKIYKIKSFVQKKKCERARVATSCKPSQWEEEKKLQRSRVGALTEVKYTSLLDRLAVVRAQRARSIVCFFCEL